MTEIEFGKPILFDEKGEKGEINLPKKLPIFCNLKICKFLPILTNAACKALGFNKVLPIFMMLVTYEGKQIEQDLKSHMY